MQYDVIRLNGMVLSYSQYGERDKRLVLLTAERGKITAFVHGVRRQNSQLQAATRPFAMGIFELRPSGGAYTLQNAEIKNYFFLSRYQQLATTSNVLLTGSLASKHTQPKASNSTNTTVTGSGFSWASWKNPNSL